MAYQNYQKQVFTDLDENDPLTAAKMDHIEAGIVALEENMVKAEDLAAAVDDALTLAKESGEFKGNPGEKGDPGDTPVKGEDYWTEDDQQAIVSDVLAALPVWEGGSY